MLLCVEDLKQFGSSSGNAYSPPYFLLDSCCSISDVSELVCFRLLDPKCLPKISAIDSCS